MGAFIIRHTGRAKLKAPTCRIAEILFHGDPPVSAPAFRHPEPPRLPPRPTDANWRHHVSTSPRTTNNQPHNRTNPIMPNWCNNQLTVTRATPELRAYLKDHGFSFGKIHPVAEPTGCPPSGITQLLIDAWGTKWDLDEADQQRVARELLDVGTAYFDTACSPPIAALEKLSAMFPDDLFSLTYCELGNHFAGTANFEDGTSHDVPAGDGEIMRIASEVFGYDEPDEPTAS